ncbi:tyrosine-type recombinase/integrase [Sodalis sp. RH19]|uniref:tyrosine-type recombinase/integrase n=1 Tax=Sodalis sp. RH19 TaxID=3394334 RepID=UPI0039B6013B
MNTVDAIPAADIPVIKKALINQNKTDVYHDIFALDLNFALRISDLLALRFDDVIGKNVFSVPEGKTGKVRQIQVNDVAKDIINRRRSLYPDDIYLFQSHSNRCKAIPAPVRRESVAAAFKRAGEAAGNDYTVSTHSCRKTRGKVLYDAGVDIARISQMLNHSSIEVTMRYIGIRKSEIMATYDDYQL